MTHHLKTLLAAAMVATAMISSVSAQTLSDSEVCARAINAERLNWAAGSFSEEARRRGLTFRACDELNHPPVTGREPRRGEFSYGFLGGQSPPAKAEPPLDEAKIIEEFRKSNEVYKRFPTNSVVTLRGIDNSDGELLVFKTAEDMKKVCDFVKANEANPHGSAAAARARYLSCAVNGGTQARITGNSLSGMMFMFRVAIISGSQTGCQGFVPYTIVNK